jgi:hypothetical protein
MASPTQCAVLSCCLSAPGLAHVMCLSIRLCVLPLCPRVSVPVRPLSLWRPRAALLTTCTLRCPSDGDYGGAGAGAWRYSARGLGGRLALHLLPSGLESDLSMRPVYT